MSIDKDKFMAGSDRFTRSGLTLMTGFNTKTGKIASFSDQKESAKTVFKNAADPGGVFRTGATAAKRAQEQQGVAIEKQDTAEALALAESTDELARKQALISRRKGGRSSLIKTSETGVKSTNLGGIV